MRCADEWGGFASSVLMQRWERKGLQVQSRGIMEIAAKKVKVVNPEDNVMVPVPGVDRAKIVAYSLYAIIFEEYSNGQFKLSTF